MRVCINDFYINRNPLVVQDIWTPDGYDVFKELIHLYPEV